MKDREIESLVGWRERRPVPLYSLMPRRIRNVLLVSSLYDFYTFEEDGRLTEVLFSEYLELNLRYAPRILRVSTAADALERLKRENFDLVISMTRVGDISPTDFGKAVKEIDRDLPVILLAYHTRELQDLENIDKSSGIDRVFTWLGDVRIFLAMIKNTEDRMNAQHDANVAGVKSLILIEDSVHFYSTYLPMLYTELVVQTQALMSDGVNRTQKLVRMRARPKILLATTYEEGLDLYEKYHDHLLGVITDASFPRDGKMDKTAGLEFARMVKSDPHDPPVVIQSSNREYAEYASKIGARFIDKESPSLLNDIRQFMREDLGFGDFAFRLKSGEIVGRAESLDALIDSLKSVPDESIEYHATRNDFSTWLMARTEFDLARDLRPRTVDEFESDISKIRAYLIETINEHLERERGGLVAEFSAHIHDKISTFLRIGSGSLGGKGRGLAFVNSLLNTYKIDEHIPGVRISVPISAVVATDIFDQFMTGKGLWKIGLKETDDDKIRAAFLKAELPNHATDMLRAFLKNVQYPIAVRSSSLLEDVAYQPFAGIYRTYMLPNNHPDLEFRLQELSNAIKMIFASSFYADSRSYIDSTPNRLEDMKMAIIIQEVVGKIHDNFLYPDVAGVARSHDFYPMEGMEPEDGVALAALGFGRTVVDGGKCVRFSPKYPRRLYQFSSTSDYLDNAQREFIALDMSVPGPDWNDINGHISNFKSLDLSMAEKHGTLNFTGSTYSPENDSVYDGISRQGVRLVTLAGILKSKIFPLADTLRFLLDIGEAGFASPVEIEYAAKISDSPEKPHEFGFLQIRPLVVPATLANLKPEQINPDDAICISEKAIGFGIIDDIRDIIYVKPDKFDRSKTYDIASEIEKFNAKLKSENNRPYLLIGPGRWGTSDQYYGIPVSWAQISSVRCIVETDIKGVRVQPSQGTHFFQNITSFGIGYFTVYSGLSTGSLDFSWLENIAPHDETEHVKWIRFDEPLYIAFGGRKSIGVILKPGKTL